MKRTLICTLGAMTLVAVSGFAQDAAPATGDGQVYKERQERQQQRIEKGEATGKLSDRQAAKLERNDAKINRQVARDAAKNGGTLTPREKAKVHGEMNHESKDIAHKKRVDPKGPAEQ